MAKAKSMYDLYSIAVVSQRRNQLVSIFMLPAYIPSSPCFE